MFFLSLSLVDRMQRMLFSRWADSGSVEGKSEQTGQRENLQLQRVHTNVSVCTCKSKPPTTHTHREEERIVSCKHLVVVGVGKAGAQKQRFLIQNGEQINFLS